MTYPATNLNEAVGLIVPDSNALHNIINGDADDTVITPEGREVPTVLKAMADSLLFKDPIPWEEGSLEQDPLQLRTFTDGLIYWAPTAQSANPVAMGASPIGDNNWKISPIIKTHNSLTNRDEAGAHPASAITTNRGADLEIVVSAVALNFDTLGDALNSDLIANGDVVDVAEYSLGNGGGGTWDVVLTSTVTPNGRNITRSVTQPTLSLVLRTTEVKNLIQHGTPDQVDDTALFQGVVDTLNERDVLDLNGKTVVIETVNVTQNHVTIRNGKLVAKSDSEGVMLYVTGDGVTIRDIESYIDGASSSVTKGTITFKGVTDGLVTGCRLEGGRRSGPNNEVGNMVGVFESSKVIISNNVMFGGHFVEMVQLDSSTDCVVTGNVITSTGNAYSAIATTDTYAIGGKSSHIISGNSCKNFRTSVLTINSASVSVTGNTIDGSAEEQGINLGHTGAGAPDCTVTGNIISNCTGAGVKLAEASNAVVVGNTISHCGVAGVETSSTGELLIADNFIRNVGNTTTGNGIKLSSSVATSCTIRGNRFKNITGNGIELNGAVVKLVVTNNHFTDINTAGFSGGRFPVKGSLSVNVPCELIVFENNVVDGSFTTNRCVSVDNSNANIIMVLANNVLPAIQTTAELWRISSGTQPTNRVIQRNKMSRDPMAGAVTMPGGANTVVVNNSNQTPFNPPILTIRNASAAQGQMYVESFSAGTFTIKALTTPSTSAVIGYEIV